MDPPTPVPYPFNSMQNPLYDSYNPPHTPKGHRGAGVLFGSSPLSPRYSDLEPPPMLSAFKSFASSLLGGSGAGSLPRNDSGAALANIGDESTPAATLKPDACLPRSADADTSSFTPRRLPSWDSEAFKSSFGRLVDPPPLSPTALLPRRIVDAEPDHLSLGSSSTSSFASSAEGQGAVPSQALGFSSSYHPAPPTFKLFQPTFGNRQQQQLADLYDDVTAVTAAYQDEGAFKESSPTPTASDGGVEESGDSVATDTAVVSHLPWIRPVNFLSPHAPPPSESEYSMPSITPISRSPSLYQVPSASIEPFEEEAVRFDEEELRFDEEGDVVPFDNDEEEVVLFEEEEEQEQEEKEEQEEEQQEQEEQEGAAVEKPQSHKSKPKPINRKAAKKARSRKNRKIDEDYQHEIPESTESTDLVADDDEAGEQVARLNNKRTFKVALWEAINNPKFNDMIRWSPGGDGGVIPDKKHFEGSRAMKSITDAKDAGGFVRQLNMWGFQRYREGGERSCGFSHPFFRRGRPDLLEKMLRKGETKPTRVYAKVQYAALMDTTPDLSLLSTPGSELDGLSLASPLPAQVRPKARKPRAPKIGGNSRAKRTSTTSTKTPGSPLKRSHSVSLEHDDIDTTPDDQDISTSSKAPASSSTKIPKHSKKRARN